MIALIVATVVATLNGSSCYAQAVTMPDGRRVDFARLPLVEKFEGRLRFRRPTDDRDFWITVLTTPPFCPPAFSVAVERSERAIASAQAACSHDSRQRLEDHPTAAREHCECFRAIEGLNQSLRAVSDGVDNSDYYATATLFITRGGAREKVRGFMAVTAAGAFRIFNKSRQPVCSGTRLWQANPIVFRCFRDTLRASGDYVKRYRIMPSDTWSYYGIGKFELSDGSRIDLAVDITDRELKIRHPEFPDRW